MIYQLPNGKSIELSIEQYLRMTDEDLKGLVAYNFGEEFNDPFIHSVLKNGSLDADDFEELDENDFTEEELQIIGELATKYDVIVMEDLAYFGMDFRKDLYTPGKPPYQPTVAKYTENYVLFISASKIFSYAGQRGAIMAISNSLWDRQYENLAIRFGSKPFGFTIVMQVLYALSSGITHSTQHALAAMFKAASDGEFNFIEDVKEYGRKAKAMKDMFVANGFTIVYEKDGDEPIADGFYFTIGYPGMTGGELLQNLLYYGISAITLKNTGSEKEGLRACVSHVKRDQFEDLGKRLKLFNENFGQ